MVHKYCRRCGHQLQKKADGFHLCSKCNLHIYENPVPCNSIILENDAGEILLVKRKSEPFKDYWDLPGGFVQLNESMEESTRREIKEELGIEILDLKYFTSGADNYLYMEEDNPTILSIFTGKVPPNAKLQATDDITDVKFFKKRDLPYEKIAFVAQKKALKNFVG